MLRFIGAGHNRNACGQLRFALPKCVPSRMQFVQHFANRRSNFNGLFELQTSTWLSTRSWLSM